MAVPIPNSRMARREEKVHILDPSRNRRSEEQLAHCGVKRKVWKLVSSKYEQDATCITCLKKHRTTVQEERDMLQRRVTFLARQIRDIRRFGR